jgi:transcriptional regulator with XRE-family HTH domain
MAQPSKLISALPFPVERALKMLGTNLRIARLRRNLTVEGLARKIGANPKSILDVEKGKASTSVAFYVATFWALGLLEQVNALAEPANDKEGLALAIARERLHARNQEVLDNDF